MKGITRFLDTKVGSIVNVALYLAASAAITALVNYLGQLDLTEMPTMYVLVVQVINLLLVSLKQAYFKK